ncbi:MAG: domain S-box-containing protein [Chitinophagaceae bacterium]|nr:domain S-box-containing protein [Chitinophagaceae bacterium]
MSELRKTGIEVLGEIPWGSHFCTFYETKQDLLDTIVPFFKAGLASNEFCLWVISDSQLISMEDAKELMKKAIPDFDRHSSEGNFEILNGRDWYLEDDVFHSERALSELSAKLKRALSLGYEGMRASGDLSWLVEKYWKDFSNYEKQLNSSIIDLRIMVLCTYPLVKSGAAEVLDVVQSHQFAIARRKGEWEVIETAMLIKAQAEIQRLNKQLQDSKIKTRRPFVILNYLLPVLSVGAALIIAQWLDVNMVTAPVSLFLCAIIFSAWYGGVKPGLLAVALSILAFKFYFVAPLYSLKVEINSLPRYLIFVLAMFFVAILSATQRKVTESLGQARNVLERIVEKLNHTNAVLQKEISVRKQAENTLRQSEDNIRLIINTIPIMAWSLQPDGFVDFVNQRWLDYAGEESIDNPNGIIHPEDVPVVIEKWHTNKATGKAYEDEMRLRQVNGEYRWFLVRTAPLHNEQGNIIKWYGVSIDIEDSKRAEDALRKSKDSIRLIIDTIPVMTWTLGPDGSVDFLNQRWLDYAGISMEEEIENPLGLVHPEDRAGVMEKWSATLVTGEPSEYEMRLRRADGEYRWFLLRTAPLHNEQGNIVKWYGVCIDIEDKKRAENELQLAYQRLSYHVENTPLAVIELDKDLFIKRWSKRAEEIFGWKEAEALGKNVYDPGFPIIYEEDKSQVDKINVKLVEGVVNRNLSLNRNNTKDGNIIYSEWYNSVLKDEHGNVITILSLVHNVTERKKAEEQKEFEQRDKEALINTTDDMIWSVSRDLKIIAVNKAYIREIKTLTGITAKPGDNVLMPDVVPGDIVAFWEEAYNTALSGKTFKKDTFIPAFNKSGERWRETSYNPIYKDEIVVAVACYSRDITERKKAEKTLNQSYEEIRRLTEHLHNIREEERTHIAREIHDELGSQLTVLKMDVSWLKKRLSDAGETIKQKIKGLIDMLDATVKSVRRISSELRPSLLDDIGLVAAMEWHLKEFEKRSGITIIFNESVNGLKVPDSIKNGLFRIFQESLTNVAKHSDAGNVKVELLQKNDELILSIEDNGKGFDKQKVREMKTLGILGMKERAMMMNGSYEIKSVTGKGTTVTVVLPYRNK